MAFAPYAWPLLALASFLVLLGTQKAWQASFGALLRQLANLIDALPSIRVVRHTIGFGGIARAIRTADASVYHWIGIAIQATAQPFTTFIRYLSDVVSRPAQEVGLLAADTLHSLTQLRRVIVPAMIAAHIAWIPRHLAALAAKVATLTARAPVHIIRHTIEVAKPTVVHIVNKAVAVPLPRIGRLEREAGDLAKRIRSLARRVPVALTAAALTAIVARTSFRWLRCSRVNKVGKHVCGMDSGVLDALIADTLLIVATISLVDFAKGMGDVTDDIAGQVRWFWRVDI